MENYNKIAHHWYTEVILVLQILLRRTKLQCAADLALPPRTVVLRKDPFDVQEADFYEALYTQSQAAFGGCDLNKLCPLYSLCMHDVQN